MGVKGLQTFLKENRQSLCKTVQLDRDGAKSRAKTPVVVDAWGVIFQLYLDSLPWTSGGEYFDFYNLVKRLVIAWRDVGLEPTFVFDGASPESKHATTIERLQQHVGISRLFYTTSPTSRSSPSFSRYSAILPPFASHTFIQALHDMEVATHFVAAGEADGTCVTIAEKLGAYVLGRDSDFVILIGAGKCESILGYCPLDMMMWIEGNVDNEEEEDDEAFSTSAPFTTVHHRRQQSQSRTSTLLPPSTYRNPTLVLINYPPQALRYRLRLPGSLLPLFASLAGNDYTAPNIHEAFFEPGMNPCQRIEKVARILRERVFAQQRHQNSSTPIGDVGERAVDLVKKVVKFMSVRGYPSDQIDVDAIIEATFQYTLPIYGDCCTSYPFCGELSDQGCTADNRPSVCLYAAAQKRGLISSITHGYLYPSRIYLWSILEDPQTPSLRASPGLQALRTAAWQIVDEGLGLLWPQEEKEDTEENTTLCDILGVDSPMDPPPRTITEYGRQGSSNRISTSTLTIPAQNPTPICLQPLADRLEIYLTHLNSDTSLIRNLPIDLQPLAAIVRLCASNSKWRRTEVVAVLKAGLGLHHLWGLRSSKSKSIHEEPILTNRNCDIVAQISAVMTDSCLLAQALLLLDTNHLKPYIFFSGTMIHTLLSGIEPQGLKWDSKLEDQLQICLTAVGEGLDLVPSPHKSSSVPAAASSGVSVDDDISSRKSVDAKKKGKIEPIGKGRFDALLHV